MDTQVLIVGAGPTGLTLAVNLGLRGVPCTLIEQKEAPQFLPKMERCNARTMEIYRRMGIADRVRAAGLPAHCPMDIFVVFSLVEPPLVHHVHPSVAQARARIAQSEDASEPLEPYQLISQYTLEPLLKSIAEALPSVAVRYGCELVDFAQDAASVSAQVMSDGVSRRSVPPTWSAAMAATAWCAGGSASHSRRGQHPGTAAGTLLLRGSLRAHPDRQGAALSRGRCRRELPDRAGLDPAFYAARRGRARRRHGDAVRARHRACRSTTTCSMSDAGG